MKYVIILVSSLILAFSALAATNLGSEVIVQQELQNSDCGACNTMDSIKKK